MKKELFSLIFILISGMSSTKAQDPNYYLLQRKSLPYSDLINDTIVNGAFTIGGVWMLDNLAGEKFSFFDKDYTIDNVKKHIVFSNNGFMRIEDDSTFIVLDAAFTESDSINVHSKLSYVVEGSADNKIIKVQWKNLKLQNGVSDNYLNYQIWLYQKTGVFEIYYGPSNKNESGYNTSNGPNIGLFYSLKTFSKMMEKIWLYGDPSSFDIDSNKTVVFKAASGVPANGTVLRFIPRKSTTSISNSPKAAKIQVYPNPASSDIEVVLKEALLAEAKVSMYDMTGKKVMDYKMNIGMKQFRLPTNHIANGLYEIKVEIDNETLLYKMEIQH